MVTRLTTYLSFVRFSHSVFALPFARAGARLAARHAPLTWP
jgi:4-hydroxybenzoate polyprenyltransferase